MTAVVVQVSFVLFVTVQCAGGPAQISISRAAVEIPFCRVGVHYGAVRCLWQSQEGRSGYRAGAPLQPIIHGSMT